MLKTLKRKFVLVNMGLVLLVLTVVAMVSVFSSIREFRNNYQQALRYEVNDGFGANRKQKFSVPQRGEHAYNHAPSNLFSFSAVKDAFGEWTLSSDWVSVDEETLRALVQSAEAAQSAEGFLPQFAAAYAKTDGRIAFVGLQTEYVQLHKQVLGACLIYLGAAAAFFLISYFLAAWVMRPVEKSWRQQRQFVADASHELKTPLTVILANLSILEEEQGENAWLTIARKEAVRMKGLVEDMLFLARSDAVQKALPQTPVPLSDLLWESALSFEVVAYEKQITVSSDIESGCMAVGDAAQLRQLIAILLDNAVKYTPAGGCIYLQLQASREKLTLSAKNSGTPIAPEHLKHLFDRFYRADEAREEGGYGLGLAIAKQIVVRHRGELSVESSVENGTVFTAVLPRYDERKRAASAS